MAYTFMLHPGIVFGLEDMGLQMHVAVDQCISIASEFRKAGSGNFPHCFLQLVKSSLTNVQIWGMSFNVEVT